MGKQLSFNKTEQKQIQVAITKLVSIMMKKHDEGVNSPNLSGTVKIKNENLQCKFDIQIEPTPQICYKSNKVCANNCCGLCKDSM